MLFGVKKVSEVLCRCGRAFLCFFSLIYRIIKLLVRYIFLLYLKVLALTQLYLEVFNISFGLGISTALTFTVMHQI